MKTLDLNQSIYVAPKPRSQEGFFNTYFPPFLFLNAIRYSNYYLFGRLIGQLILPAQFYGKRKPLDITHYKDAQELTGSSVAVQTHDGVILDTYEIKHNTNFHKSEYEQFYIIKYNTNGMVYQNSINDLTSDAARLKCNVVAFNYRGVGNSTGVPRSKDDLVVDGIAQVQRLLDKGADPSKIMLDGWSLGGAVSTLVAQYYHDRKMPVYIFNNRSFSSLTRVVVGLARSAGTGTGYRSTFLGKVLGWMLAPFIKIALLCTNWEMNVGSVFKNLPWSHKEYLVAKSNKSMRTGSEPPIKDDVMITDYASIHAALKSERKSQVKLSDEDIKVPSTAMKQRRFTTPYLYSPLSSDIPSSSPTIDSAHMKPLCNIVNSNDASCSGLDFYDAFFSRIQKSKLDFDRGSKDEIGFQRSNSC